MINKSTQKRILCNYKLGKETRMRFYKYSIQYNPIAATHTYIVRQPIKGGEWEFYQPLDADVY